MHELVSNYKNIDIIDYTNSIYGLLDDTLDFFNDAALIDFHNQINELKKKDSILNLLEKYSNQLSVNNFIPIQ